MKRVARFFPLTDGAERVHLLVKIATITRNRFPHILYFWIAVKPITWTMFQMRVHIRMTIAFITPGNVAMRTEHRQPGDRHRKLVQRRVHQASTKHPPSIH